MSAIVIEMLCAAMAASTSSDLQPWNRRSPYYEPYELKSKPQTEYTTKFGEGKKKFEFDTAFCKVEIWADNPNSAQKKLRTVKAINQQVNEQLQRNSFLVGSR